MFDWMFDWVVCWSVVQVKLCCNDDSGETSLRLGDTYT